ncbi:hypothetical protein [Streptomyces sp. NPDC021608]|uniref:hypothetical protein n=1 Tax=Streptomyces sp. NPDC021608 TaxID=3154903 RepID=UPI0033F6AE7C
MTGDQGLLGMDAGVGGDRIGPRSSTSSTRSATNRGRWSSGGQPSSDGGRSRT